MSLRCPLKSKHRILTPGYQYDAGIYPETWHEPDSDEYVIDNFIQLKDFYKKADNENQAVITFIN